MKQPKLFKYYKKYQQSFNLQSFKFAHKLFNKKPQIIGQKPNAL